MTNLEITRTQFHHYHPNPHSLGIGSPKKEVCLSDGTQIFFFPEQSGDFPVGPVVKTLHFQCRGHGFDPWSGT